MIKAKLVAVFSAIIAVLAISATPAFAEFQSNSAETHGTGKSGEIVLEGGGATLNCTSADGEWKIQTKGPILEHNKLGKQEPTTKGPHLNLTISKWNGCKAKSKEIKEVTPTVGACTLQLEQPAGSFTAKGGVVSACKVEIKVLFFTCVITVPPANEQTGLNFGLVKNTLENSGSNLITVANDSGITTEAKGTCLGVVGTNTATEKGTITGIGLKAV
jgi:hypothetical protein